TNVSHRWVLRLQLFQTLSQVFPHFLSILENLIFFISLNRRERRRTSQRMAIVSQPGKQDFVVEEFGNLLTDNYRPKRNLSRWSCVSRGNDSGNHGPAVHCQPLGGAAPSAHRSVATQQGAVRVAGLAHARPVFTRRHDEAVAAGQASEEDRCNLVWAFLPN